MIKTGSRSFYLASLLLPRNVFQPAMTIYAFCRLADDAADTSSSPDAELHSIRKRLNRIYQNAPIDHPVDRSFCDTVHAFGIPKCIPDGLLEGLQWDCEGRRYNTIHELHDYSARVAGTVGVMMAIVMGARSPKQLKHASDLGIAMQLTNIARDIGEDATQHRLYLPLAWLRDVGISPDLWLSNPKQTSELAQVSDRLIAHADELYAQSRQGIASLPLSCRMGIDLARRLYREIGIHQQDARIDPVSKRSIVPTTKKIKIVLRSFAHPILRSNDIGHGFTKASETITERVCSEMMPNPYLDPAPLTQKPWWNVRAGTASAIELFLALELRDRKFEPIRESD